MLRRFALDRAARALGRWLKTILFLAMPLCIAAPIAPAMASIVFYTDPFAFNADAPSLALETFDTATVDSGVSKVCSDPYDRSTADTCWKPGDIAPGLGISSTFGTGTVVVGSYFGNNPTTATGAATGPVAGNAIRIDFPPAITAVGLRLIRQDAAGNVLVSIYGPGGVLLTTVPAPAAREGSFLGMITLDTISRIEVSAVGNDTAYVDNVQYGAQSAVDLALSMTSDESPAGTLTYTVNVSNPGGTAATGVKTSIVLPPELPFVSDDCGLPAGAGLAWNVANLPPGQQVACHIVTSAPAPTAVMATARVYGGQWDPAIANNAVTLFSYATGVGPGTPKNSITLLRSFPDLAFKDQDGAPFSFRANADKVILLQMCAVWCVPCNIWTQKSASLQSAVDQAIGPGHFLDVDMLWQGPGYQPSTQTNATNWKTHNAFPGPVLHAEGSLTSPVSELMNLEDMQYYSLPPTVFRIPHFLVLAPGCENQIAVRGTPDTQLPEERMIETSTIDDAVALVTQVWQQRPCIKPLLHRMDMCGAGSAPILSVPANGKSVEAADVFTVPAGSQFDIAGVTAVTDAPLVDFAVYADAGGVPGTPVCTSPGRAATPLYGSGARHFALTPRCKLGPGNYWMSLKGQSATDAAPFTWYGGLLPRNGPYLVRDALNTLGHGCTSWSPAGTCVAAEQQKTELCFVLDQGDVIFGSGFETAPP